MSGWLTAQIWLVRAALLALPVLVWLARRPARAWLRDVPRGAWWGLAVVLAVGVVARAFGSVWSVHHENGIGWVILEDALALERFPSYGLGGHVLHHATLTLLPRDPASVFAVGFVLGSLTPGLLFLVAWGLLRHAPSALLAAALLAASPAHVRLSASESLHVPLLFFGALGLAALLCAVDRPPGPPSPGPPSAGEAAGRRGRREADAPLLLAAVALALAVQMRPLGALLVLPVALVVALKARQPLAWLRSAALWRSAALALALVAIHVAFVLRRVTAGDGSLSFLELTPAGVLPRLLEPAQHALVDPATTPLALQLCAVLGVVALALLDRRALAILLPTWALFTWFHTTSGENPVDPLRFHMGPLPWAVLIGGAALLPLRSLAAWGRRAARIAVPGVTVGALLLAGSGLALQRDVYATRYDAQREAAFLRSALPHLPASGTLAQLDRFTARRVLTTVLPLWWLRAAGHGLAPLEASRLLADPAARPGGEPLVWYRGATCWTFDPTMDLGRRDAGGGAVGEAGGRGTGTTGGAGGPGVGTTGGDARLRPLCRAVEDRYRLVPLAETSFRANPDRFVTAAQTLTIGFYRLEARRRR